MTTLTDSFWRNEKNRLLAILQPRLTQMAFEAAKQASQKAGIGFNPALANANAANWARNYTDSLLDQLGTTSEKGIGDLIGKWVETPGATYGELQKSLMQFGAVRAQAIAVTETTRAYSEGEMAAYKQEGITEWTWRTNNDEITCPICAPLNNKTVKIGEAFGKDRKGIPFTKPPSHVNCRCWTVAAPRTGTKPPVSSDGWKENISIPPEIIDETIKRGKNQVFEIVNAHNTPDKDENNGSSFSLYAGNMKGKNYYSTSIYPDMTLLVEGKEIDPKIIQRYITENISLLSDKRLVVGTWYNPADNTTYIDISVLVENKDVAQRLSERYNQWGMFHLGGDGYISTNGGGTPLESMPYNLDRL